MEAGSLLARPLMPIPLFARVGDQNLAANDPRDGRNGPFQTKRPRTTITYQGPFGQCRGSAIPLMRGGWTAYVHAWKAVRYEAGPKTSAVFAGRESFITSASRFAAAAMRSRFGALMHPPPPAPTSTPTDTSAAPAQSTFIAERVGRRDHPRHPLSAYEDAASPGRGLPSRTRCTQRSGPLPRCRRREA